MKHDLLKNFTHVVVRPHADDECIGCFELYHAGYKIVTLAYPGPKETSDVREQETMQFLRTMTTMTKVGEEHWCYHRHCLPFDLNYISRLHGDVLVWLPCETDINPLHRRLARLQIPKSFRIAVGHYSIQMDDPTFVRECLYPKEKQTILNECFPSQKRMWEYESKYFLYEGRMILC